MAPATTQAPLELDADARAWESDPELLAAFAEHEQVQGSQRLEVGCYLTMILLPLGSIVDYFLYDPAEFDIWGFARLRVVGALLIVPLLFLFRTAPGRRHYRILGILLAVIPGAVMAWIIHEGEGTWPYYAGINLILLAMATVAQWTWRQSLLAWLLLLGMYLPAAGIPDRDGVGIYINNLWFLVLTGIIMVVGSELQYRLRFRDFAANAALRRSRRALEMSYERLQELDELKGRFFANVSHELRTPLTLLLAPIESLLRKTAREESGWREPLETMRDNSMRLLKLINDLLDLVRLDAGRLKLNCSTIEVPTFLRGLVLAVHSLAEERGLRLTCDVDPGLTTITADPDKLEKVFLNLLFNAIKFTAAGGSIRLSARWERDWARFDVTDSGMGVAPEDLPSLFSRFWQADSSSQRKSQGVGIGLALVKELVTAHGGSVSADSTPGKGTTMTVWLPREIPVPADAGKGEVTTAPARAATPAPAPLESEAEAEWLSDLYRRAERFGSVTPLRQRVRPLPTSGQGSKPRVLVVDDEPDMLRFLQMILSTDYEVIEGVDGDQAVTLANQYLPDVIVCDLMLPEKDGLQVCRELRSQTKTRVLPLLMLTARADDETKLRALEAGANDFLVKPFSLAELSARVKSLSDSHQLQFTLSRQNQKLEATLEELRDTEMQLVQAEKMASLGRMSAGIIHEINNPLNYALTAIELLSMKATSLPDEERAEYAETVRDIEEGLRRVAGIIGDLRIFTHPQGGEIEDVPVRHAANAALRFLAAELKNRVVVENRLPESLTVPAVRSKLIQVFVNLLQNSLDALAYRMQAEPGPRITLSAETHEGVTTVRVRDNGHGIPPELQSRIFDPFFTTKEVGQGTGLGLSICFRLLNEVGASITVESQVGEFSEFILRFAGQPPRELAPQEAVTEAVP